MLRKINTKKNKSAQSLMLSYVILISIVIAISIGVFAWLRTVANVEPIVDCKEGTSIILSEYACTPGSLKLTIKNNGRFNIDGIILAVSNDSNRAPSQYLEIAGVSGGSQPGAYFFEEVLKNSGTEISSFLPESKLGEIKKIQIQPFIEHETGITVCTESLISQELVGCSVV